MNSTNCDCKCCTFDLSFDDPNINVGVNETPLDTSLHIENEVLDASFDFEYSPGRETYYEGDYVVIPKANVEQVLETKNKKLYDNVTVKEVPYFETSNDSGETVYIASGV